jgi:hypothetical protein
MGSKGIALPFLASAVDEGDWPVSLPGRIALGERVHGTHWAPEDIWTVQKTPTNVLPLPGTESWWSSEKPVDCSFVWNVK